MMNKKIFGKHTEQISEHDIHVSVNKKDETDKETDKRCAKDFWRALAVLAGLLVVAGLVYLTHFSM